MHDLTERLLLLAIKDPTKFYRLGKRSDRPEVGLIATDGGPKEMFLPFRTLTGTIAGYQSIGSIPSSQIGKNVVLSEMTRAS